MRMSPSFIYGNKFRHGITTFTKSSKVTRYVASQNLNTKLDKTNYILFQTKQTRYAIIRKINIKRNQ